jgi:cytochrome c oxidase subunit 3
MSLPISARSGSALPRPADQAKDNLAFGFPVFLFSESIIFLSFFVTYSLLRLQATAWFPPGVNGLDIPLAAINTVILISSSLVIHRACKALNRNRLVRFRRLWLLTIALGIGFLFGQAFEWSRMPFGLDEGLAGSSFYLLTGFHGLHVFTGVVLMLLMYLRSLQAGNYARGHQGVEAVALFWHFVDGIWLVLFALLYLWRP